MSSAPPLQPPLAYAGYSVTPALREELRADGDAQYLCTLTATELAEAPTRMVFSRTVAVSQAQAAVMNQRRPGVAPERSELEAILLAISVRYLEALIDLVNRGFRTIAPTHTLSTHEARSRLGMTDAALSLREGVPPANG